MRRFEGKVVLITGAARGQGRAHAVRMASEGANVIAVDICDQMDICPCPMGTSEDLDETVRLVEDLDQRILAVKADVRDGAAMKQAVDDGIAEFGQIDVVVANAGIFGDTKPTHELSEESFRDVVDVVLIGVWNSVRHVVPHMIERGEGGSLVMISSAAGMRAYPGIGDYTAAKHGVVGLMRVMAVELAEHSIRVNSVHPTNVDTPLFNADALRALFVPGNPTPTDAEFAEAATGMNLLPIPWVQPEDMAAAVAWIASDEARYVTGVTLPVDAGVLVK